MYEQAVWSLLLREDNRVVMIIFGPKRKRKAITGEWRKLCSEELHYFYSSSNITGIIKIRIRWADVAHMRKIRNAYKVLIIKCEGKRHFGRTRH
jgi:hypothetical protein